MVSSEALVCCNFELNRLGFVNLCVLRLFIHYFSFSLVNFSSIQFFIAKATNLLLPLIFFLGILELIQSLWNDICVYLVILYIRMLASIEI